MKRVAIVQSSYVPWKGYFDMIRLVDEFVLFDEVQFTRRDWRNRNQIRTAQGLLWLSIPVVSKGRYEQKISETRIGDPGWAEKHWKTIQHAYGKASGFADCGERIRGLYERASGIQMLSEVNRLFLEEICAMLGVGTPLRDSGEFEIADGKSERLLSICEQAGADVYLSGPAAKDYLDEGIFEKAGVGVDWMDYSGYPEYPQIHGTFEHHVSILDLLMNTGAAAASYVTRSGPDLDC